MRILFLDDVRQAPPGWVLARTVEDFCKKAADHKWDVMSLDHDLGDTNCTGYGRAPTFDGAWVADWLVRNMDMMPSLVLIHSSNPVGAGRMHKILQPHVNVRRVQYSQIRKGKV